MGMERVEKHTEGVQSDVQKPEHVESKFVFLYLKKERRLWSSSIAFLKFWVFFANIHVMTPSGFHTLATKIADRDVSITEPVGITFDLLV